MSYIYTYLPLEPIAYYIFQHVDFKSDFYDMENYKVRKRMNNKPQIQVLSASEGWEGGDWKGAPRILKSNCHIFLKLSDEKTDVHFTFFFKSYLYFILF